MSEQYVGEIRLFAGSFAPVGWALCHGQTLPIVRNEALFALLGNQYGGDGITTFRLPDLRGRVPIHQGQGPGLTRRALGDAGGQEAVRLTMQEMPVHTHGVRASAATATSRTAVGNVPAALPAGKAYSGAPANTEAEHTSTLSGSQPHDNMQPYLAINYIIATEGVFPPRS